MWKWMQSKKKKKKNNEWEQHQESKLNNVVFLYKPQDLKPHQYMLP
jgi:hypothetical protein